MRSCQRRDCRARIARAEKRNVVCETDGVLLLVCWCPGPESNRYAPFTEATDFKSVVSTYFTTRAVAMTETAPNFTGFGRLRTGRGRTTGGGYRNRTDVYGFAIRCITTLLTRHWDQVLDGTNESGKAYTFPEFFWSGKRVSNSRPQPWQGCALPTELFPHQRHYSVKPFAVNAVSWCHFP